MVARRTARRRDAWGAAELAKLSAAFLAATLASDALRLSVAKAELAAFGVPTERGGSRPKREPRKAIPPSIFAAPVTVAPGGVYLFTPGDFSRSLGRGPAFVDVLLPARDLARRFPRTAGQAPALLEEALGRKPEPGEADAMAAQQAHKAGLITRTGTAGRPTSRHLAHAEHRRRIAVGEAHASLAAEARHGRVPRCGVGAMLLGGLGRRVRRPRLAG